MDDEVGYSTFLCNDADEATELFIRVVFVHTCIHDMLAGGDPEGAHGQSIGNVCIGTKNTNLLAVYLCMLS